MGRPAQKRLVRKRDLERALSSIEVNPAPKACFEQYATPSTVAADVLHLAAYVFDDILDKTVMELGCGTARLAIGAVFLGAKEVFGVDIDSVAVKIAQKNADLMNFKEKTNWVVGDIDVVCGNFDTVLQNPPFGVQKRRADRRFIVKSLELGHTIYSFHKGGDSNRAFIKRFIEEHGGKITNIFPMTMEIPRMFKFHTKEKQITHVDLYRIEGKN
ncbi:MAG: 50S ribosomal protein L11 methyltransferase [Candidatus Bathyarchaeota archaeon]|nr:METTL5 family protein [Candidatus Bathyarchaeum tardum]WGM89644.1 MAG: METTL5 family protein [Candidatus Bathyarchaeum tardum]WNZ30254.1 MAG: 50S ribosomal protein L11 methyltransferase [Candidatus Bathyarchaeota archaeon]